MDDVASWAALALRLGTGTVFFAHGLAKFRLNPNNPAVDRAKLTGAIESMRLPWPLLWTYAVLLAQLIGGMMLVAGLFTSWVALMLAVVMLTAACFMQKKFGFILGADFPFALFFAMLALFFLGDGRFSLGALLH